VGVLFALDQAFFNQLATGWEENWIAMSEDSDTLKMSWRGLHMLLGDNYIG